MRAMKKFALIGGVLVAALGIGGYVVYGKLGTLIKRGVETYGPPLTGTSVELSAARLSLFSGEGSLHGLTIGNPKGYSDNDAFDLSEISISVDPKSVTGEVIHVRSIVIDGPELLAEFNESGRSNLDVILDKVRGGGGRASSGKGGGKEPRLRVDEFRFENAKLRATAPAYKLDKEVVMPAIVIKDIGGKNGVTPSQLASEVLKPVIDKAARTAVNEYVKVQRGKLVEQGKEQLMDKLFGK